jgi:DNA-binding transcriptional regulator LsrR (DeoR family)
MRPEDLGLAYRCSDLYYRGSRSQAAIAEALGISRPRVSRLLAAALELGIVTITVKQPELFDQASLERALVERYGLKRALVGVPEENSPPAIRRAIGVKFQENALSLLFPNARIGIGIGSTIYEMARSLRVDGPIPPGLSITPLTGLAGRSDPAYQVNNIVDLLAEVLGAGRNYLMTPAVCEDTSQRAAFLASPQVAAVVKGWERLDVAIFGIGGPIEESAVLFSSFPERYLVQMVKRHAVGDILARFFGPDGASACPESDAILLSIPPQTLSLVRERVALAGGRHKIAGIKAALNAGLVTTLVTDLFTAQELVEKE